MGDDSDPEIENNEDDNIKQIKEISSITLKKVARVEILTIDTIKNIVFANDNNEKKSILPQNVKNKSEDFISNSSLKSSSNLFNNLGTIDYPVILETNRENDEPEMIINTINSSQVNYLNLEKSNVFEKFKHFVFNPTLSEDKIWKHLEFTYKFLAFSINNLEKKPVELIKLGEIVLEKLEISNFLYKNLVKFFNRHFFKITYT